VEGVEDIIKRGVVCPFLSAGILAAPQAMMVFHPGEKISAKAYSRCLEEACAIFNRRHKACSLLIISCAAEFEAEQGEQRITEQIRETVEREFRLEAAKREIEEKAKSKAQKEERSTPEKEKEK